MLALLPATSLFCKVIMQYLLTCNDLTFVIWSIIWLEYSLCKIARKLVRNWRRYRQNHAILVWAFNVSLGMHVFYNFEHQWLYSHWNMIFSKYCQKIIYMSTWLCSFLKKFYYRYGEINLLLWSDQFMLWNNLHIDIFSVPFTHVKYI